MVLSCEEEMQLGRTSRMQVKRKGNVAKNIGSASVETWEDGRFLSNWLSHGCKLN